MVALEDPFHVTHHGCIAGVVNPEPVFQLEDDAQGLADVLGVVLVGGHVVPQPQRRMFGMHARRRPERQPPL